MHRIMATRLTLGIMLLFTWAITVNGNSKPNFIFMMADDLGYGDLYSYSDTTGQEKNEIDRMADEGVKFVQWTAGGSMCTPSRASFLTARYPPRSGIYGSDSQVFAPSSIGGLPQSTTTLAEALQVQGYTTGMLGKWHLGINAYSRVDGTNLPGNHGFDWVGTNLPHGQSGSCDPETTSVADMTKQCFLYNGSSVVQQPINTTTLSEKLRDDAITFIQANDENPFFLYLAFPQVHHALFCNEEFCDSSTRDNDGYGDAINEMAWVVGEILDELESLGLQNDTLVIFTSDQGASSDNCRSTHYNGGFRGGKGQTWEGAYRVPALAWWPNTLPANTESDTLINHMDVFPTFVKLAGGETYLSTLPDALDGQVIPDFDSSATERESFFYYCSDRLMAVRYKEFKVHFHTMGSATVPSGNCNNLSGLDFTCYGANIVSHDPPLVYDLSTTDGKSEETTYSGSDLATIISEVEALVTAHEASMVLPTSEIDKGKKAKVLPCCDQAQSCVCNYP